MTACSQASPRKTLTGWLELLRLPNLFTVPGDALAGAALVSGGRALPLIETLAAVMALLFFYAGGLIMNDLADREEDSRDRPMRPIPSGRVGRPAAVAALLFCFAAALACCTLLGHSAFYLGLILALLISFYNMGAKRVRILGPLAMGTCRSLSLLLGASVFASDLSATLPLILAVKIYMIYIALVTLLASYETREASPYSLGWWPPLLLAPGLVLLTGLSSVSELPAFMGMLLCAGLAVTVGVFSARNIHRAHRVLPAHIGQLIGAVIFYQAACLFLAGHPLAGLLLAALWLPRQILGQYFYSS